MGTKTKAELEKEIAILKEEHKKKLENKFTTTKKILWLSWIMFVTLIVVNACGIDTGLAMEVVGGIVTAVTTGFYLWKSKCENKEKIALGMVDELAEKYGIEAVIQLLDAILED